MKALGYILTFVVGAGLGAAGGYMLAKQRYEKEIKDFKAEYKQRNQEFAEHAKEVAKRNEEMKEKLFKKYEEEREAKFVRGDGTWSEVLDPWISTGADGTEKEPKVEANDIVEKESMDMTRYKEHIQDNNYRSRTKEDRPIRKEGEPYVIDCTDYDDPEFDDYEKDIEFRLWDNGVITDDADERMDEEEIEDTIGHRWKYFFEDNPNDDACYIRNEEKQIDYILVKAGKTYM